MAKSSGGGGRAATQRKAMFKAQDLQIEINNLNNQIGALIPNGVILKPSISKQYAAKRDALQSQINSLSSQISSIYRKAGINQ